MNSHQIKILQEVPEIYRETFAKAFRGESRSCAVKAFCLSCVGHIRKDITDCTAKGCPLYPYRPYQRGEEE